MEDTALEIPNVFDSLSCFKVKTVFSQNINFLYTFFALLLHYSTVMGVFLICKVHTRLDLIITWTHSAFAMLHLIVVQRNRFKGTAWVYGLYIVVNIDFHLITLDVADNIETPRLASLCVHVVTSPNFTFVYDRNSHNSGMKQQNEKFHRRLENRIKRSFIWGI